MAGVIGRFASHALVVVLLSAALVPAAIVLEPARAHADALGLELVHVLRLDGRERRGEGGVPGRGALVHRHGTAPEEAADQQRKVSVRA